MTTRHTLHADPPEHGWRWAPAWVLTFIALWPAPGVAEGVMVLGALAAIVKLLFARFRGVTPEPGAHTTVAGQPLKVLEAAPAPDAESLAPGRLRGTKTALHIGTGTTPLAVTRVQPAGKGAMNAVDWWRGLRGGDELVAGA